MLDIKIPQFKAPVNRPIVYPLGLIFLSVKSWKSERGGVELNP